MVEEWMRTVRLPMSLAEFHELPRNPSYRYELLEGVAVISPRPRYCRALLDLAAGPRDDGQTKPWAGTVRPLRDDDWTDLLPVFAASFSRAEPFFGLEGAELEAASRQALDHTQTGGDGPVIGPACVLAEKDGHLYGAALVTLLPALDPTAWNSCFWRDPPPPDAVEKRLGRPHLTWIFVRPGEVSRGVGSALLHSACEGLRRLGYTELLSTFLDGNNRSMLWHWRMGFTLLQAPDSYRRTLRAFVP